MFCFWLLLDPSGVCAISARARCVPESLLMRTKSSAPFCRPPSASKTSVLLPLLCHLHSSALTCACLACGLAARATRLHPPVVCPLDRVPPKKEDGNTWAFPIVSRRDQLGRSLHISNSPDSHWPLQNTARSLQRNIVPHTPSLPDCDE